MAVDEHARVEGELLMVDTFLNHRVEIDLMLDAGRHLSDLYRDEEIDLVLTAEASGIPPAMACAQVRNIPYVYARKYLGVGDRYALSRTVASPTRGTEYRVEVSRRVIAPGNRVLIVDDFLSGGRTAYALGEIALEAGADVVGFAFLIEKRSQRGRSRLEERGWRVESLLVVDVLSTGTFEVEA